MPVIYKSDRLAMERLRAVPPTTAPLADIVADAPAWRPPTLRRGGESLASYIGDVARDGMDPRGLAIATLRQGFAEGTCHAETLPALLAWADEHGYDRLAMRAAWQRFREWRKARRRVRQRREATARGGMS